MQAVDRDPRRARAARRDRRGRVPRRVGRRRCGRADVAVRRRVPRHRRGPRARATTSSPAGTPVTTCTRARDDRWIAVGAIEPHFFANLCRALGCEQWLAHQTDDAVQDAIRADFARRVRDARPRRVGRASSARPTRACRRSRRCPSSCTTRTSRARAGVRRRDATPTTATFEQVGWVLAGMDRAQPGPGRARRDGHRHRRAAGRGRLLGRRDRGRCEKKESRHDAIVICRPRSRS